MWALIGGHLTAVVTVTETVHSSATSPATSPVPAPAPALALHPGQADAPRAGFTPFLRASLGLHLVAAAAPIWLPGAWPWSVGALLLNHAAISGAGLWPRARLLGPNITRLPPEAAARGELALTLDDGPCPQVTPLVLDLLDLHQQRATFFVIAQRAAAYPALLREITARGHSVQNHSFQHRHNFSLLGPRGYARELSRAQETLADLCGEWPRFFRAPAGLRNPFLQAELLRQGLQLTSWTRRGFDTRERDPARVLARLMRGLAGGDILLLHDHHSAIAADGRPVVLHVLPALLSALGAAGLRSVTLPQALPDPLTRPAVLPPLF